MKKLVLAGAFLFSALSFAKITSNDQNTEIKNLSVLNDVNGKVDNQEIKITEVRGNTTFIRHPRRKYVAKRYRHHYYKVHKRRINHRYYRVNR